VDPSGASANARCLVVGCGTSELSAQISTCAHPKGQGWLVHSIDIDKEAIESMQAMYTDRPDLTWEVLDIIAAGRIHASSPETASQLESAGYTFAVDKGTLDYFLCNEAGDAVDALNAVHNALADGGILLVISIHPNFLLQSLFSHPDVLGFQEVQTWSFPAQGLAAAAAASCNRERASSAIAVRRVPRNWGIELRAQAVEKHVVAMDAYLGSEGHAPLLTPEREAELRSCFAEASSDGRVPLAVAHKLMFPTPAEQEEYTLDFFLEDLRGEGNEATFESTDHLTIEQAVRFLRDNQ